VVSDMHVLARSRRRVTWRSIEGVTCLRHPSPVARMDPKTTKRTHVSISRSTRINDRDVHSPCPNEKALTK